VDRREAAQIVAASGQGSTRDLGEDYPRSLFSEDMWNDSDTEMADLAPAREASAEHLSPRQVSQPIRDESK
jgi:hypothetical protein